MENINTLSIDEKIVLWENVKSLLEKGRFMQMSSEKESKNLYKILNALRGKSNAIENCVRLYMELNNNILESFKKEINNLQQDQQRTLEIFLDKIFDVVEKIPIMEQERLSEEIHNIQPEERLQANILKVRGTLDISEIYLSLKEKTDVQETSNKIIETFSTTPKKDQ